jgi:Domain of unknown function (DUF222)
MSGLGSAIDELAAEDLEDVTDAALSADVVELRRQCDRLEAQWLRRVTALDRRGTWQAEGAISPTAWLRDRCRLAPGAARERVVVGRRVADDLDEARAAFADGDIGYGHVRLIVHAAGDVDAAAVREAEPVLVDAARTLDPRGLTKVLAHWRHAVDPEAFVAAEADAHERRRFDISETFEAMTVLDGQLYGVDGAIVRSAIDAYEKPLPDDARTPTQRRADALVALARQALDRGELATTGGERPHLNVLVSLETLEGRAGARGAELDWGGVISGEAARRLACDCGVSRIITAGKSEPLDVGRRMRTPSAALRRAVIARDRHCVEAGCDRPPGWCQVHHKKHWVDGGATRLEDLELRCDPHHYDVHEGQWKPERARRRRAQARPP